MRSRLLLGADPAPTASARRAAASPCSAASRRSPRTATRQESSVCDEVAEARLPSATFCRPLRAACTI